MFEHEHPLKPIDLWSKHINYEEESDEDADENEYLATKLDFECKCDRCDEKINWYHRYYYKCDECHYSIHKFCQELPATLEHPSHVSHTLILLREEPTWRCDSCETHHHAHDLRYRCSKCDIDIDVNCAMKLLRKDIIHHPSHIHPLVRISATGKQILCECDACGKEHKGIFYQCVVCSGPLIHGDCAFLSQKLFIQQTTYGLFSHTHPLTLDYSFSRRDHIAESIPPRCRVCNCWLNDEIWIYKCDKCRYYADLDCATFRGEPFMSILTSSGTGKLVKNYEDEEYPNLLHLPFPDQTYSILKHLFYTEIESIMTTLKTNDAIQQTHIGHQHPLVLVDVTMASSSRILKKVSYHNPTKKIEVLCDGCLRPIMNPPFYMCTVNEGEHCNFVLHEWCTRLPAQLNDHPGHPQHSLVYYPKIPSGVLGVFYCSICRLHCNGFVYCCVECQYYVDVCCAFIPEKVTHKAHPNHLLSRFETKYDNNRCRLCQLDTNFYRFVFSCKACDIHLHTKCALLLDETITHSYDKHPMQLSYFPIENHKSEYFCEICEETLDPEISFYHCHGCVQSIHSACAPSILQSETCRPSYNRFENINEFVNIKFGGFHYADQVHQHPLLFVQGIEGDGKCNKCYTTLNYDMVLKCQQCKFAIHYFCLS